MSYFVKNVLSGILNAMEIELKKLKFDKENYNPNKFSENGKIDINKNHYLNSLNLLSLHLLFSIIFYCFPIWFIVFPFRFVPNFIAVFSKTEKKNNYEQNLPYLGQNKDIQIYLMDSKLQIRNFLSYNSKRIISIKVLIGCFPIIFGVSKTFYSKYKDQTFLNLFKNNLPGMSSPHIEISWPTFEQIFSNQLQFEADKFPITNIYNSSIKRVDFYTDFVLMQTDSNWHTKQKQLYLGVFNTFESGTINTKKQIGNNWYSVFSKYNKKHDLNNITKHKKNWNLYSHYNTKNITLTNQYKGTNNTTIILNNNNKFNYFLNLDELPLKLNSNYSNKYLFPKNIFRSIISLNQVKFNQKNKKIKFRKTNKACFDKFLVKQRCNEISLRVISLPKGSLFHYQKELYSKSLFPLKRITSNKSNESLIILKKTQTAIPPIKKSSIETDFINFAEFEQSSNEVSCFATNSSIVSIKKIFLENKLKENFYKKNLLPFSNLTNLDFLVNVLKKLEQSSSLSKNIPLKESFKTEILMVLKSISSETWISSPTEVLDLLELIQEISTFYENSVISPRLMSGYALPDSNNQQNLSLLAQFFYKKNTKLLHTILSYSCQPLWNPTLEISLSKNFSYALNFLNTKLNKITPSLKFYLQPQLAIYHIPNNQEKTIYEGPSITQNRITNELNATNQSLVKQWIKQFLNSDTILTDRREIFFGKNVYTEQKNNYQNSRNTHVSSDKFVAKQLTSLELCSNLSKIPATVTGIEYIKLPLLKKGRAITFFETPLKSTNLASKAKSNNGEMQLSYDEILESSSIISYKEYPYVIYLDKKEWNTFFEKLSKEKFEHSSNEVSCFATNLSNELTPIANVRFPKQRFIAWPLNQLNLNNFLCLKKNYLNRVPFVSETTRSVVSLQTYCKINKTNNRSFSSENRSTNIPIIYHYFPYSQTLLKEILPKKYFFGKVYKKNSTIYPNEFEQSSNEVSCSATNLLKVCKNKPHQFTALFYESVEPISMDSWLFFAQFSIGLFLLQILQNISQKYGKEMKYVISSLLQGKNENSNLIDTSLDENAQYENFRLIKNIEKKFRDIAGIDAILPELSEIVWFLRNSGRSFKIGSTIPRRILLTGPPGTGKTLLVQAIAGEAEVPVLIESGSSLNQPGTSENGSERLKNIFNQARKIAPCIIFIDEIDTFGEARDQMLENPIINNEILTSIYTNHKISTESTFQTKNLNFIPQSKSSAASEALDLNEPSNFQNDLTNDSSTNLFNTVNKNSTQGQVSKYKATQEKSNLLMQFLIELDGISTEKKILVFGATNRPQILDTALTRPGRFNKVLNLNLPNKQKRIEILKLYSKNLGIDTSISWNYLANLTPGLSAADLASVMNQSSMKAIQNETIHTVQTIEYGIQSITGYITQKNQLKSFTQLKKNVKKFEQSSNEVSCFATNFSVNSKSLFINRLAYYQAGKAIIHTLLKHHPQVVSIHLWPQLKNPRYHLVNGIIEKEFSQIRTRIELESRIIGFYGGKAAELLALFHGFKNLEFSLQEKAPDSKYTKFKEINKHQKFLYLWQSDLGIQDINFAGWLAQLMINKWYLYSTQILTEKFNQFQSNSNYENISNYGMLELFKQLSYEIETETNRETVSIRENSQNWITKPWLQRQITKKLEFSYSNKSNWYKIYEGDHEENENTRCILPDEYYHNNTYLKNLLKNKLQPVKTSFSTSAEKQLKQQDLNQSFFKSSLTWNNVADSGRDYIFHSLILTCFNKSISILDQNRELLDFFASSLIQKEIIREYEIITIINSFLKNEISFNKPLNKLNLNFDFSLSDRFAKKTKNKEKTQSKNQNKEKKTKLTPKKIFLEKNWGKWSRRKPSRFINFNNI